MSTPTASRPATSSANLGLLAVVLLLAAALAYAYNSCNGGGSAGGGGAASWASNGISESSSGTLFKAVRVQAYPGSRLFAQWKPTAAPSPAPRGARCKNWAVTTTIFAPTTTVKQIASLPDWCLVIAGDRKTPHEYNVSGNAQYLSPAAQESMPFATGKLLRWNHFGRKNLGFLHAISQGARWVYDTDDDNELQSMANGIPLPRPNALVEEVSTSLPLYNLYPQMSTNPSSWPRGFPLEAIKDNRTHTAGFARKAWAARRIGVVQSLADHDPDVDGIYRLTQPLPFTFPPATRSAPYTDPARRLSTADPMPDPMLAPMPAPVPAGVAATAATKGRRLLEDARSRLARLQQDGSADGPGSAGVTSAGRAEAKAEASAEVASAEARAEGRRLAKVGKGSSGKGSSGKGAGSRGGGHYRLVSLREGTMMPYNAQATLHAYEALWGLLLPCTVHGRVTDIWRAYFTQRLLWDVGFRIAFSTPWVTQYRNAHNYLADFNSELPLYQQAGALVQSLEAWKPTSDNLPGRLEELYIYMYEMAIVGLDDVKLAQAWLQDLARLGYRFPPIVGR